MASPSSSQKATSAASAAAAGRANTVLAKPRRRQWEDADDEDTVSKAVSNREREIETSFETTDDIRPGEQVIEKVRTFFIYFAVFFCVIF